MVIEKVCTCCKILKSSDKFRIRTRDHYKYFEPKCKECEIEYNRKYLKVNKEKLKEKAKIRGNKYHYDNREKILKQMKERRSTPEYKKYMKEYRLKNKEKIKQQELICKDRYFVKHRDGLTDSYVIKLLKIDSELTNEDILKYPHLIELKRQQIKLIRLTK